MISPKRIFTIIIALLVSFLILSQGRQIRAESLEEIEAQIAELSNQLQQSVNATTPLESEVKKLNDQVASIQAQIAQKENSMR